MKKNRNMWKSWLLLLFAGLFAVACGDDSTDPQGHTPAIDITYNTLTPNATGSAGESGSVRAYIGTEVTAKGFNLDKVTSVTLSDLEAEIVEQSISEIRFKVPALALAQRDEAYANELLMWAGEQVIFRYDYYVTVPVTDALVSGYSPASGTVGTLIKIEGRNLEQVTEIRFAESLVKAEAFSEVVAGSEQSSITFAAPAGSYVAGESAVAIEAVWGADNRIDVTGENPFLMQTPRVDPVSQPEGTQAAIGDEMTLTGEFLDLVSQITWSGYELIVLEQSAASLTLKFPSSIEPVDPVVVSADIAGCYGEPAQPVVLVAAWRLDTTPQGPAKPVLESFSAEDGGEQNRFYLGKIITVKGQNMASIEGFVVDGVVASLVGEPNDVEAQFVVPDGVTFTEAKEVAVEAVYGGGTKIDFGTATVYPFYYFKGVRLGLGSNSKSTYTEYASENTFFYPDLGRVVSASEWLSTPLDPYAVSAANSVVKVANTLTAGSITADEYYDVLPYLFFISNSSHKLSLAGCANSSSQIKTHCTFVEGAATSLPSTYGTPLMMYRALGDDKEWSQLVREDKLTSLANYDGAVPSQGAPALGAEVKDGSTWMKGSVIAVGYYGFVEGEKPSSLDQLRKVGFLHVVDVTCADLTTGAANKDRVGYIEFDFYWSKTLNE